MSIPANIAEGYCRRKTKAYANHVSIALGSHAEVETHVEIAFRLGFLSEATRDALQPPLSSLGRLLTALHQSLDERVREQKVARRSRPTST